MDQIRSDVGDARCDIPRLVPLPMFENERGRLYVAEFARHLGFAVRRFYFMTDVPAGGVRGVHAHKRLRQGMLCLKGAVTVELEKSGRRWSFRLDRPDRALLVPPGCWRVIRDFDEGAVIGVLASQEFDPSDYIDDYAAFHAWEGRMAACEAVPYLDPTRANAALETEIESALLRVLRSGRYIGGAQVEAFEMAFAAYCDAEYAVGVANGADALTLALRARGIGEGASVVVPANVCAAAGLAVARAGARPLFVDVEEDTGAIDPEAAAAALCLDTRAVLAVHFCGHPADMGPLRKLADRHGLFLLEEAAQAPGARYRGRPCGSLGDAAAFGFCPTDTLGALGEAGALVSNDTGLVRGVRALADGRGERGRENLPHGGHSRLDPVHAAVLAVKLRSLDLWTDQRRRIAERYRAGLGDLDGLRLPAVRPWATPAWYAFCVRVREGRRDALRAHLTAAGIGTDLPGPRIDRRPIYRDQAPAPGACPFAEGLAQEMLGLPIDAFHEDAEIDRVIAAIREFFA